jgi:sterol desaturase/sphingolipid hydroxylase (fatty acid hydroxylase superfamily)
MPAFLLTKGAFLAAWALLLAVAERARPAATRPSGDGARLLRNGGLWAIGAAMNPVVTLPLAAAAAAVPLWSAPETPLAFVVHLLALDLWAYAWHRAYHTAPLLWRFHEVHHRDVFLDATSAVRFHPGEILISALARAPLIILLDIPFATIALFDALLTAAALFHHSNVRLPVRAERVLRMAVVTPSHHWVHHHAVRRDTDSNYGALLTLWDRVFRTLSPTPRTPDMPIGAEGAPEIPLGALLVSPFRPRRGAGRSPPSIPP